MIHRAGAPAPPSIVPVLLGSGVTAVGHRRDANEDAFLAGPHWYVVADGMGGHAAGDIASRIAVDAFASRTAPATIDTVPEAVAAAHASIRRHAAHHGLAEMGTTIVGAAVVGHPGELVVFHVGDSRCYRLADDLLEQVTIDHSHVQELLDAGRVTPAEASTHPLRNVVTRALGVDTRARPDITVVPATRARLLLCSDGLSNELTPAAIRCVLATVGEPQAAAERLVELALAGPARDNVTALVVDVVDGVDGVDGLDLVEEERCR